MFAYHRQGGVKILKHIITIFVAVVITAGVLIPVCLDDSNPNLYVFVIAGQSNAEYAGTGIGIMNDNASAPNSDVLYYGSESMPIQCGYKIVGGQTILTDHDPTLKSYNVHSMYDDSRWRIGCLDAIIADKISNRSDVDVMIINVAIGGASVEMLQPNNIGGQYVSSVINDAMSKIPSKYNVTKLGYAWLQGEADATTAESTYIDKFHNINSWYNAQGFPMCYMVQTRPYDGGNASSAQLTICNTTSNVVLSSIAPQSFTVANGLMNPDNRHYSGEGRYIVGSQIGDSIDLITVSTNDTNGLIKIVPLIVIISIVIMAIGMLSLRRV